MCQKRKDENKMYSVYILGTRTREMMNESRILGAIVVATSSSLIIWGLNVNVQHGYEKKIFVG
jgi:hypothetical protein